MRRKFVAGNWKMNLNLAEAKDLVSGIKAGIDTDALEVGVFPPAYMLTSIVEAAQGSPIMVGAQNCYFEPKGAFTGELSVDMIKDAGCSMVLIGHSERRHVFGEPGEWMIKKIKAALDAGLHVVYCIGETLEEREGNQTEAVLKRQLEEGLAGSIPLDNVTIAYEPVWAIGTGKTATPEIAQEAHAFTRKTLTAMYNDAAAQAIRIQYGGSVKASNAQELMGQPDVDGALVGGASLKTDEFLGIIKGAAAAG